MSLNYLGEHLIFIISQPRSGSTLLQRVLAGSDAIVSSSEPWLMLHPVYGLREHGIKTDYSHDWAVQGVTEFLQNYTDGPEVYDDGIRSFAKTIYDNAMASGHGHWFVDKTPRYLMILPDLLRLFPEAKFVFLIRNPLSVLASIVNTQISHDLYTLERFREELLDGPAAILDAIDVLGDRAHVVRYEAFVAEPEVHTRELCESLGVTYEEGMVDYADTEPVEGFMQDRTGIQQHTRPNASRVESWRQLLTSRQQVNFAQHYLRALGRDTVERLGYDYDELNDAVRDAANRTRGQGGVILPWQVALLHPQDLKGRDQLAVSLYRNVRDKGAFWGRVLTARDFLVGVWRSLRFAFGSSAK